MSCVTCVCVFMHVYASWRYVPFYLVPSVSRGHRTLPLEHMDKLVDDYYVYYRHSSAQERVFRASTPLVNQCNLYFKVKVQSMCIKSGISELCLSNICFFGSGYDTLNTKYNTNSPKRIQVQLVKALRYKPEGCGFISRWLH